jgi:hypothetical protein
VAVTDQEESGGEARYAAANNKGMAVCNAFGGVRV